ncbi:MAG: hypothetical protein JWL91_1824 [Sphingomonas bacterium]|nr:hypothetical protein [Sphingomonas bacterium]MDB5689948.1 hypothetical protein [Sphingomonas bacterium]
MQRVRVGLTGLACVFLLVFLAAAFFGLARPEAAVPGAPGPVAPSLDANATAEPREPLAELGVTPGNLPGKADSPPAAPFTVAPGSGPALAPADATSGRAAAAPAGR